EVSPASRQREETAEEKAARKARKRARKEARRAAEAVAQTAAPSAQPSQVGRKQASNRVEVRKPTRIQTVSALLEKKEHRVTFEGNVIVTQDTDESRAERMVAYTDAGNHLERIEARGNAYLKQAEKAEIKSPDMDFFFGESHQIARAVATGGAYTK